MRHFNRLAAVAVVLLAAGGVCAKERTDQPKPRKICRTFEEPGRITPRKICRIVPEAAADGEGKAGNPREAGKDRN